MTDTPIARRAVLAAIATGVTGRTAVAEVDSPLLIQIGAPKSPPPCPKNTPQDCRFAAGMTAVTLMGHLPPEYNRDGQLVSPPPGPINTATTQWSCVSCGARWEEKEPSW